MTDIETLTLIQYCLRSNIHTNVGERTVLDLVSPYKGSGINVTTDNFFTTIELGKILNFWKMTLVGTVRKNKRFLLTCKRKACIFN